MGLRRSLNAARDHEDAHDHARLHRHARARRKARARRFARALAATLVCVATVTCGTGYGTAVAGAAATTGAKLVVNVHAYGAKGDGHHNDSLAVQQAIKAAAAHPGSTVYLPSGVYYCPTAIQLASRVNLKGAGMSASWLEGHLEFGSRSTISRLKIGADGVSAVTNLRGANHTLFIYDHFRGGGRAYVPVIVLGGCRRSHKSCSFITFKGSDVERNLGTETNPPSRNLNDITIFSSYVAGETAVHDIKFDGDNVGVSNGQSGWNIGSPRMAIEVWPDANNSGHHLTAAQTGQKPWYNVIVTNCTFEATDWSVLDFSDQVTCDTGHQFAHSATGVVVRGNRLEGAGHRWPKAMGRITFEGPCDSVCSRNTIYQGGALGSAIQVRSWEKHEVKLSDNTFCRGYGPAS